MRKEAAPRNLNDNCYPSFQSIWSSLAFWSPSWASSCFIFPPTPTKKWISVSPFYSDSWSSSFLSPKSCPPPRRSVSWWSLYRKFVRIQYFDINPFSILTFYPTFQPFIHLQSPYITQYLSLSSRWFPWSPNTSCSRSSWIFWRSWWRSLSSTGVIERPPRTKCPSGSSSSSLSISRDCCSWGDLTKRPCWVSAYVHARACVCVRACIFNNQVVYNNFFRSLLQKNWWGLWTHPNPSWPKIKLNFTPRTWANPGRWADLKTTQTLTPPPGKVSWLSPSHTERSQRYMLSHSFSWFSLSV